MLPSSPHDPTVTSAGLSEESPTSYYRDLRTPTPSLLQSRAFGDLRQSGVMGWCLWPGSFPCVTAPMWRQGGRVMMAEDEEQRHQSCVSSLPCNPPWSSFCSDSCPTRPSSPRESAEHTKGCFPRPSNRCPERCSDWPKVTQLRG